MGDKIILAFRNDDFGGYDSAWRSNKQIFWTDIETERRSLDIFAQYNVPQTYGVVPKRVGDVYSESASDYRSLDEDSEHFQLMKDAVKSGLVEVALHGFNHLDLNPKEPSEFRGRPYTEQLQKITQGKALLEEWFNQDISVFIPPWNTYDLGTIQAMRSAGLNVLSAHRQSVVSVEELADVLFIPSTCTLMNLETVLRYAMDKDGIQFIIVMYHSHNISDNYPSFSELESIVQNVATAPDIEVMTLGEIASKYGSIIKQRVELESRLLPAISAASTHVNLMGMQSFAHTEVIYEPKDLSNLWCRAIAICLTIYLLLIGSGIAVGILVNSILTFSLALGILGVFVFLQMKKRVSSSYSRVFKIIPATNRIFGVLFSVGLIIGGIIHYL